MHAGRRLVSQEGQVSPGLVTPERGVAASWKTVPPPQLCLHDSWFDLLALRVMRGSLPAPADQGVRVETHSSSSALLGLPGRGAPLTPLSLFRAGWGEKWGSHASSWELCVLAPAGLSPADPPRVVSLEEPEPRLEHCIEFMVRGNPPPTLHWLHNGQPLRESKIIRVEFYQEGEVSEGCLLFNKPTHYNNGNYTLIAKNPLGTANQTINGHFLKEPFPGEALRSGAP